LALVELIAERPQLVIVPRGRVEVQAEPADVGDRVAARVPAGEEPRPAEDRMTTPKGDELSEEGLHVAVAIRGVPVEPADLVVLGIGIVVPTLRAQKLIAAEDHRRAG